MTPPETIHDYAKGAATRLAMDLKIPLAEAIEIVATAIEHEAFTCDRNLSDPTRKYRSIDQ